MTKIVNSDLENISQILSLEEINSSSILITGITGLIGSLLAKTIIYISKKKDLNIHIIGLARNLEKTKEVFSDDERNSINFLFGDINESSIYNNVVHLDYIIHTANVTSSKYFITNPVETIDSIYTGTKNILNLAKKHNIISMLYISSMEVYGEISVNSEKRITENTLGNIDILNVRSSYSEGKRAAECLCHCYAKEYNISVKIARLAQTFGPGVSKHDTRVFMQFINSIIEEKDIILHTSGKSYGNYCDTHDAILGLFTILLKGESGEAYNIVNESSTMMIFEMANLVAKTLGNNKSKVSYDITQENKLGYAPQTGLKLSSKKIEKLDWHPTISLEESYKRLFSYMKENVKC